MSEDGKKPDIWRTEKDPIPPFRYLTSDIRSPLPQKLPYEGQDLGFAPVHSEMAFAQDVGIEVEKHLETLAVVFFVRPEAGVERPVNVLPEQHLEAVRFGEIYHGPR